MNASALLVMGLVYDSGRYHLEAWSARSVLSDRQSRQGSTLEINGDQEISKEGDEKRKERWKGWKIGGG